MQPHRCTTLIRLPNSPPHTHILVYSFIDYDTGVEMEPCSKTTDDAGLCRDG
ncbi:MAG: hypothetical protein ABIJ12_09975 [bacterium]